MKLFKSIEQKSSENNVIARDTGEELNSALDGTIIADDGVWLAMG